MSQARERLIETAVNLFKQFGYRGSGVDRIVTEAGIAKMTLYNHFRTKEDLILAALRRWDEDSRNWILRAIEERESNPRRRLLVLFDVLDAWFDTEDFRGCLFINAAAEFGDVDDPIHKVAAEHKRLFLRYLTNQSEQAGAKEPAVLAGQLALLMEGAIVTAQVSGQSRVGVRAKLAAETLIDRHTRA